MPMMEDLTPVARKPMVTFFVVDPALSGCWENEEESFFDALNRTIPVIRELEQDADDTAYRVAVLAAGENPCWQTPEGPVSCREFQWENFGTDPACLNGGLEELNEKLDRKAFMQSEMGMRTPVIFFLLHGDTLGQELPNLEKLQQNRWYQSAGKIVLQLGGAAEQTAAEQLSGRPDTVIQADSPEKFALWLEVLVRHVSADVLSNAGRRQSGCRGPWDRQDDIGALIVSLAREEMEALEVDPDMVW